MTDETNTPHIERTPSEPAREPSLQERLSALPPELLEALLKQAETPKAEPNAAIVRIEEDKVPSTAYEDAMGDSYSVRYLKPGEALVKVLIQNQVHGAFVAGRILSRTGQILMTVPESHVDILLANVETDLESIEVAKKAEARQLQTHLRDEQITPDSPESEIKEAKRSFIGSWQKIWSETNNRKLLPLVGAVYQVGDPVIPPTAPNRNLDAMENLTQALSLALNRNASA